ncbi:MAG: short-chain dehydrogenase [Opitutaceae bacterium]|nr:short-chain dehydrogenase [Opitutaceae bacterium]
MGHMYSESLEGKVAIVTGADRGIGRAVAEGYAAAGAHVVISSRTETDIQLVASEIESDGGKALPILYDVTQHESVQAMVDEAAGLLGGLDILFINAGGNTIWNTPIEEVDPGDWHDCIELNLNSTFYTTRARIPYLKKRGSGKIILMGSGLGYRGQVNLTTYSLGKARLWHFTRLLAEELLPFDITVNEMVPGIVHTKLKEDEVPERKLVDQLGGSYEYRKLPEDVVPLALHLATMPKYGPTPQTFSLTRRWI